MENAYRLRQYLGKYVKSNKAYTHRKKPAFVQAFRILGYTRHLTTAMPC